MAKREFNLPGIQELNKDQKDARALPKQGMHLIVGGPGTGKSVVALLRARRHRQDKEDYVFLVYNKLLNQASRQLFGMELISRQWQSWFQNTFTEFTGVAVPNLPANDNGWAPIDWERASEIIANSPTTQLDEKNRPFLIIDEGQDMPLDFYQALINLGFENFYVVADGNQQIAPGEGSRPIPEIASLLGYEYQPADIPEKGIWRKTNDDGTIEQLIDLLTNYRNTHSIAKLAKEFFTYSTSKAPELPGKHTSSIPPILVEYKEEQFSKIIKRILINSDTKPNKIYGIIAPTDKVRDKYYQALKSTEVKLDNAQPRIETYSSNRKYQCNTCENLSFDEGGIMVINAQSCKGLEFDTVFLADINRHYFDTNNPDQAKRLFYVMVARAKDHLIMLKQADNHCSVETILPKDIEIMERK